MGIADNTNFEYKPLLIVVSGPSGVGKGVVIKEVLKMDSKLAFSVSATTRPKRIDEVEGRDYFFLSRAEFNKKRDNNEFLEWAEIGGNYYGTLISNVQELFNHKFDVLLDIDVQGAEKIKNLMPDCVTIFLLPPSRTELENRLRLRGTDDDQEIIKRLSRAKEECRYIRKYDYWFINQNSNETASFVYKIINVERHKTFRLKGEIVND